MSDIDDLYRRIFLAETFARGRNMPRLADAFHDLGEALLTAAPGRHAAIADLVNGLATPRVEPTRGHAGSSIVVNLSALRPRARVAS